MVDTDDNVATVLQKTSPEEGLVIKNRSMNPIGTVVSKSEIPYAHKICLSSIKKGGYVYKYGVVIGRATADINVGDHVHIHNVISIKGAESVVGRGLGD